MENSLGLLAPLSVQAPLGFDMHALRVRYDGKVVDDGWREGGGLRK